jgi:hypothetical protein
MQLVHGATQIAVVATPDDDIVRVPREGDTQPLEFAVERRGGEVREKETDRRALMDASLA